MATAKATGTKKAWQSLIGNNGYMGISLHSRNHQGEGLEAMIDWANQQNFKQFRVCLSDTLNRFNYAHEKSISIQQALSISTLAGDKWLKENSKTLSKLSIPFDIVRWSHWLNNHKEEVEKNRDIFSSALKTNTKFHQSIMDDVHAFSLRKTGKLETDTDKITVSIKYLIEELAVYSVILRDFPATTIYPGKQLNSFAHLRNNKPEYFPSAISDTGFIRLAIHGTQPSKDKSFTITQSPIINQNNLVAAA